MSANEFIVHRNENSRYEQICLVLDIIIGCHAIEAVYIKVTVIWDLKL